MIVECIKPTAQNHTQATIINYNHPAIGINIHLNYIYLGGRYEIRKNNHSLMVPLQQQSEAMRYIDVELLSITDTPRHAILQILVPVPRRKPHCVLLGPQSGPKTKPCPRRFPNVPCDHPRISSSYEREKKNLLYKHVIHKELQQCLLAS